MISKTANNTSELKALYQYLKENHFGYENRIKARDLALATRKSVRKLRAYCEAINRSSEFERLISTSEAIYLCKDHLDCAKALRNTYRQAISLLNKARAMEKKIGLNGQLVLDVETVGVAPTYRVTYGDETHSTN